MKDYKHIEHMRNLNDSLIWERMKRCYDYGYEDGQKEKLAEYEDKQKAKDEIKVGYEVYNIDRENKRIVTAIDGNKAIQLRSNGKYTVDNIDTLHWTGREDLRIKKVMEKITNEV